MTFHSSIDFLVPVLLVSEANQREHWAKKSRRKKSQRAAVRLAWNRLNVPRPSLPVALRLTRIVPKRRFIRDKDNLVSSFKAVIDEVADCIGENDKNILWLEDSFQQEAGEISVRVEIIEMKIGEDLTPLQHQFLVALIKEWSSRGIPPTILEMQNLESSSWSHAQSLFKAVQDKEYIERVPGVARGIRMTPKGKKFEKLMKR